MKYRSFPLALLFIIIMSLSVLGAGTITIDNPNNNEELAIGYYYTFSATSDLGGEKNCTWDYRHKGLDWDNIGLSGNDSFLNAEVPLSYGTNSIRVICNNNTENATGQTSESITFKYHSAGEASEVSVDLIVGIMASLFALAVVIALILVWIWIKPKTPKL